MKKMYKEPKAIGNRVVVEVEIDEQKAIKSKYVFIPDSVESENRKALLTTRVGTVIQIGNAGIEESILTNTEEDLKPGHIILFLQNAGVSFKHEDENKIYRILSKGDIMAVVGEES